MAVVCAVAAFAAVVSYAHIYGLGRAHGQNGTAARLLPLSVRSTARAVRLRAIRAVRRRPWQGELPVGLLAEASFPTLVISGNHSPAFEAVCDALAARMRAQRAHITGAGHATPETGDAFNRTLEAFIRTAR